MACMEEWQQRQYLSDISSRISRMEQQLWSLQRAVEACLEPHKAMIRYLAEVMREEAQGRG